MKNDKIKFDFINEYISSYERKIKNANKNHLYDEAKLFENFALKICSLYYSKKFVNLNFVEYQDYPCVDLKSEDGEIFIQVSTCIDYDSKIYKTLNDIKNSQDEFLKSLKNVNFFFLYYENEEITDRTGDKKIGNIEFDKNKNLITTSDILKKCRQDEKFLTKIYEFLKDDEKSIQATSSLFIDAIDQSRVGIEQIKQTIGENYEIDRSEIISEIDNKDKRIVTIIGNPGCGKSVVAKSFCNKHDYVLYVRGETLANKNSLNDIWGFDLKNVITLLGDKELIIFVDSLEFLVDKKDKIDLIFLLANLTTSSKNVKLIMTCRDYDFYSFSFLLKKYNVTPIMVNGLSDKELNEIILSFPFLKKIHLNKTSSNFLRVPFYLDLVVKYYKNDNNLFEDGSNFRNKIFDDVLCCKKLCENGIAKFNEVRDTVLKIAEKRAKDFVLDLDRNEFDNKIVNLLISQGVLIEGKRRIRFKYDIFEDICFESIIEKLFVKSKENIKKFIESLKVLGKSAPRRFQIWIDGVLRSGELISKFVCPLVFEEEFEFWGEQAIIGISKSKFSSNFSKNYSFKICDEQYVERFLTTTNLYAHKMKPFESNLLGIIVPEPIGSFRNELIRMIFDNKIYKKDNLQSLIYTLCDDASRSKYTSAEVKEKALKILCFYFDNLISQNDYVVFTNLDFLKSLLTAIYSYAEIDKNWIVSLWTKLIDNIEKHNDYEMVSAKIIEHTISNYAIAGKKEFIKELFDLMTRFYQIKEEKHLFRPDLLDNYEDYGLGTYSEANKYNKNNFSFLKIAFVIDPIVSLECSIEFVNNLISNFSKVHELNFININYKGKEYKYYSLPNLWVCNFKDFYDIPFIIRDMFSNLVKGLINKKDDKKFLDSVKDIIFTKSNNIGFLSVLNVIGIELYNDYPGYSIELMQSLELILFDLDRFNICNPSSAFKFLEDQIYKKVGLYNLDKNDNLNIGKKLTLRDYVLYTSINYPSFNTYIFGALKKLRDNYKENTKLLFQIDCMDIRKYKPKKKSDNFFSGPKSPYVTPKNKAVERIANLLKLEDNFQKKDIYGRLKQVIELEIDNIDRVYIREEEIVKTIALALSMEEIDDSFRNYCISFWANGFLGSLEGSAFVFNENLFNILLNQLDFRNISEDNKNKITRIILLLVSTDLGSDSILNFCADECRKYLMCHSKKADEVFNVLCVLAHSDEKQSENFEHEKHFSQTSGRIYSKQEEVIDSYLNCRLEKLQITAKNIKFFDLKILAKALNCGLLVNNENFKTIKIIFNHFLDFVCKSNSSYFSFECDLKHFAEQQFNNEISKKLLLELFFTDYDFSSVNNYLIDFYKDAFSFTKILYLDAKGDQTKRYEIEKFIKNLEVKIINSSFSKPNKERMFSSLIMSGERFVLSFREIEKQYSEYDKMFLCEYFSKYAYYNYEEFMHTLHQFDARLLMPEIIVALDETLSKFEQYNFAFYKRSIKEKKDDIEFVLILGMTDYISKIKMSKNLSDSFESLLNKLIKNGWIEAAIALDIFRAH